MNPRYVEVVITPSHDQYRELAADLDLLKASGDDSNTVAILASVRERADRLRRAATYLRAA